MMFILFYFFGAFAFQIEQIQIDNLKLKVEVATTVEEHALGLMRRTSLAADSGMLFVFEDESIRRFWMKNTYIPLTIGFFDKSGVLVDMQDMEPVRSEIQTQIPQYQSLKPAKYALEVNRNWFKKNKLSLGAKLKRGAGSRNSTEVQALPKTGRAK